MAKVLKGSFFSELPREVKYAVKITAQGQTSGDPETSVPDEHLVRAHHDRDHSGGEAQAVRLSAVAAEASESRQ
jgi:hypothetical protein